MKLQRFFYAAVGAMTLAACSSADEYQNEESRTPITLTYSTLAVEDMRGGASQTLNDANIATGRAVTVCVSPNTGAEGGSEGDFIYTAADYGAMTAPTTPPYYPTTGSVKITAYHPSDAAAEFTVQSDQSTDEGFNASDLMYSNNLSNVEKTREAVNLKFEHKMAKLVVNVEAGAGVSTIQKVTVKGVKPTVEFNSATGTVGAASGTATDITLFTDGEANTASGAVVFPGQELSGALLDIVTDKGTATYTLASAKTYEAGKRYTLNLTVNLTAVGATNTITWAANAGTCTVQPTVKMQYLSMSDVGPAQVGWVIASDGNAYKTVSDATAAGTTASGMIAYVGNLNNAAGTAAYSSEYNHGLAVALTEVKNTSGDEGYATMTWFDARTAASAYKRTRPSASSGWFLPSLYQWQRMFIGCGSSNAFVSSWTSPAYFTYANIQNKMTSCGGTDFKKYVLSSDAFYWSSTENNSDQAWEYSFCYGQFIWASKWLADYGWVRAVFAF